MIGVSTHTPASRPSILLVEDEAIVALDLALQLEDLGYDVVGVADTAAAALELAERHRPDLTLMDVVLQGDGDGIDAAAAMKARGGLPVIFLTSFSDSDTVRRAAETGPYGYLTKPFQIRELRAGIEVALAKARLEREVRDAERCSESTLRCVQSSEQANRSTREFLARMGHEMRTPLNAVIGFAQLLQMQPPPRDAAPTAYVDHILSAGRHLLSLVDDVLQLQTDGRAPTALQTIALPLVRVVDDALMLVGPFAVEHGIAVSHAIDPTLHVRAEERRLRQVLVNLVSNAVKYNRPGGTVVCSAHPAGPGRVQLEVRDNGIGMTPEQSARLFEPFDRLGREASAVPGTGLGLVISRALVEQMDGRLSVCATSHGTLVTVELPAKDAVVIA